MLLSNKEIYKLDLAITTACNFRCKYCFVRKTNKVIDYRTAKTAINLLLSSPGKKKMLIIYGGEPLLYPGLLKKIILFVEKKAKSLNKEVIISLGTNGVLSNSEILSFLDEHNVNFCLSFDGKRKIHDKNRRFRNGRASFKNIYRKIFLIKKELKNQNICVLAAVHPNFVSELFNNYKYIITQGITSVNIEPIQGVNWTEYAKEKFLMNFIMIAKFIIDNLRQNKFFFLNSLNRIFAGDTFEYKCPFYRDIEIYPSGDMSFSGFLINSNCKEQYLIGNLNKCFYKRYSKCELSSKSDECKNCRFNYFQGGDPNSDIYRLRNLVSLRLAKYIQNMSNKNILFKNYIIEAKKRRFE